jgi:hypothetical protein
MIIKVNYRHKTPEEEKIEKAKIKPIRDKELASRKPMATKTPEEETRRFRN